MARSPNNVTAHIKQFSQDSDAITSFYMDEAQVLELISLLTVALREKAPRPLGYYLAIWKQRPVGQCQASPRCSGGEGSINLVRRNDTDA